MWSACFFVWSSPPSAVPSGQAVGRTSEVSYNNAVAALVKMFMLWRCASYRRVGRDATPPFPCIHYPQRPPLPSISTSTLQPATAPNFHL